MPLGSISQQNNALAEFLRVYGELIPPSQLPNPLAAASGVALPEVAQQHFQDLMQHWLTTRALQFLQAPPPNPFLQAPLSNPLLMGLLSQGNQPFANAQVLANQILLARALPSVHLSNEGASSRVSAPPRAAVSTKDIPQGVSGTPRAKAPDEPATKKARTEIAPATSAFVVCKDAKEKPNKKTKKSVAKAFLHEHFPNREFDQQEFDQAIVRDPEASNEELICMLILGLPLGTKLNTVKKEYKSMHQMDKKDIKFAQFLSEISSTPEFEEMHAKKHEDRAKYVVKMQDYLVRLMKDPSQFWHQKDLSQENLLTLRKLAQLFVFGHIDNYILSSVYSQVKP